MVYPISPGIETSVPSFLRRYNDPAFQQLPPEVVQPIMQLDYNNAIRGAPLIPKNRLPNVLRALQTGQAQAVREEDEGFTLNPFDWIGRVGRDVGTIVKSIPRLPITMFNEFKALPTAPQEISKAMQAGGVGAAFDAPGLRLLPGSYAASALLPGGQAPETLLEHPLFAALDVAPYTKMGLARAARTAPGQKALQKVGETADRFGVGPVSKTAARLTAQGNRTVAMEYAKFGKRINELERQHGVSRDDVVRLTEIATTNPAQLDALPARERGFVEAVRTESERQQQRLVDIGLAGEFQGEFYPITDYNWFMRQQDKILRATEARNLKQARALQAAFDTRYARRPPMRYRPVLLKHYQQRLFDLAKSRNPAAGQELWDEIGRNISEGLWDREVPNVARKEMRDLANSVAPHWIAMKNAGLNPVLNVTVAPEHLGHLTRPTLYPLANYTPSMVKAGTWKVQQGINDFSVGLGLAEYEYLRYVTTQEFIDTIEKNPLFSRTKQDIENEHLSDIRAKGTRHPGLNVAGELQLRLSKDWEEWDPASVFPTRAPRQRDLTEAPEPRYINKAMAKTLRQIYASQTSEWKKTWDAGTKVFRTSILPMSPRWHTYNILGGLVMLMGRADPSALLYFGEARRMLKDGRMPVQLSRGFFDVPEESRLWSYGGGKALARMVEEHSVGYLWRAAEWVDSMYRAMAYLYGEQKALGKEGMTPELAREAGAKLSNKILQDWDSMVPFERQVIRSIVPFYGWMRHILNYTFTYPWDHPYRASIVSNFARNEIEDWQSGLPEQFQHYFFFGNPDQMGNERGFNIKGANPFSDVGNYFTLAGFFSQLHPAIGGLMEAAGINPMTGKADLYPELYYNEETGRLEPRTPNPVMSVAESLLPPLPLARGLLRIPSGEERQMQLSDPQAYRSMLFSAGGIPFVPKKVNKRLELARSELRRNDAMQDAFSLGLRTGDWSEAQRYPQLRPILEQIEQLLAAGALESLRIQPRPVGIMTPNQMLEGLPR